MVDAHALSRLVGEVAGFLTGTWGRAPLHVAAADRADEAPTELLTLDDVDRIVAGSGLRAPAFRLVRQGVTLPQSAVTRTARIGSRPVHDLVDVAAVHRAVGDGATLVLQGLHRSYPPVADFCRDLEQTLTHPVQANAYLTPPVAQGLNLHEDPHDVFAVQTHGTKRWVVHTPDDEVWDLTLVPGDVLYLPAGARHAAQTVGSPSLHLTIGVRTVTWRRLVERTLEQVLAGDDLDLDRSLPAGWADQPGVFEAELTVRLGHLVERLGQGPDLGRVLDREADHFWANRPPDLTGGLQDVLDLDHLDDHTMLRRRPRASARLADRDDARVELVLGDRRLRLPAAVRPALERVVAAGTLRPVDLDELLDAPSRLVLCRRLVREGLLTVERSGATT